MATMTVIDSRIEQESRVEVHIEDLIQRVHRIGPIISAYAEESEQNFRLSRPIVDALRDAGLFRMMTPRSLGGLEVDPVTYARVVEEVSKYYSAAGWALCNPLVFAHGCSRLPEDGIDEIFGDDPNVVISAAVYPPMKAAQVDGGYRITGRTPFVSNCHDATWFCAQAMVMDGDQPQKRENGSPEMIKVYTPISNCEIIETWSVMGMRGTGSDDVAVTHIFVPTSRTSPVPPDAQPGLRYQSPLYRLPGYTITAGTIPSVMLGIARSAVDYVSDLAQGKTPATSKTTLRDKESTQSSVAQAEAAIRSGRALLHQTISDVWEMTLTNEEVTPRHKANLLLAAANAVSSSVRAVELMYNIAGTSGFYTNSPLERHFRDAQVLKQHAYASEARYQSVGQVYLGLESDFPAIR